PVMVVAEGVRSPVAAKADLLDDKKNALIRYGDVYFRTLSANGTPSTAPARPQDWPDIVEICFNNREADFGRFLRRQLAGHDLTSLFSALSGVGHPPAPNLKDRTLALLQSGRQRFDAALADRKPTKDQLAATRRGSWEGALVIDPPHSDRLPDDVFLRTVASSNPQYTGWPIWLDSRSFTDRIRRSSARSNSARSSYSSELMTRTVGQPGPHLMDSSCRTFREEHSPRPRCLVACPQMIEAPHTASRYCETEEHDAVDDSQLARVQ